MIARISNDFGPQDPADGDGMDMSVARGHDVPRGRIAPLTEALVPPVGTTVYLTVFLTVFLNCWSPTRYGGKFACCW